MRVFVTGAAGFVGSAVAQELIKAGHQVTGLSRSEENTAALKKVGVKVHSGSLEDLESLRQGAAEADGVVHCAFSHDFSKFEKNTEDEKRAIDALGSALAGSNRPLVVTSGIGLVSPGRLATEDSVRSSDHPFPRDPETTAFTFVQRGVRVTAIRLPPITHDESRGGFLNMLLPIVREKGAVAYIGDGQNVWSSVHRLDAAVLYRLALEKGIAGARYHAVDEEGVAVKEIATTIGRKLNLPVVSKSREEAPAYFGWFLNFAMMSAPASSKKTQNALGWRPTHLGLIADIDRNLCSPGGDR
jgi:nucleoside-diphosphate-sugar epimerase